MEKDVAILMADLTGYTAMTDVHGGASAARIVQKYMELVDSALYGDTQIVQRIGDQVVMIADTPSDIAITAQRLNTLTSGEHHFLSTHTGIHYGAILQENGNLFGSTINVAARIMNLANRCQILCSADFVGAVNKQPALSFVSCGMHKLKNVLKEIELFELQGPVPSISFHIDPVCHMLVDPEKDDHILTHENRTFHFCSLNCLKMFKSDPGAFTA
jgi:class 3 adenylate cyclase